MQLDPATLFDILIVSGGSLPIPIPPQPSLRGALLVAQGLAFEIGSGQLATSTALVVQLGN